MSHILIACFTHTGTSEKVARRVMDLTGGDLFPIRLRAPYPKSYGLSVLRAGASRLFHRRPQLTALPEDISSYDTLILVYPIWWYGCPQPVRSFLRQVDTAGKTVYPIATMGSSGFEGSLKHLALACPAAMIRPGLAIRRNEVDLPQTMYDLETTLAELMDK